MTGWAITVTWTVTCSSIASTSSSASGTNIRSKLETYYLLLDLLTHSFIFTFAQRHRLGVPCRRQSNQFQGAHPEVWRSLYHGWGSQGGVDCKGRDLSGGAGRVTHLRSLEGQELGSENRRWYRLARNQPIRQRWECQGHGRGATQGNQTISDD